ncbi:hypothetical protein BDP27DRAFT_54946 [Rhodocollybia butyracea]|uniref:Uncharacterized protein n=1 Tax=Rhodocollybia butyracea TaxID=206335 RepID=A0A9P5PN08_9AGAR|nr:hypothetical protein BDP27DRAFT_54946 [Rhodocollybia butyracea]
MSDENCAVAPDGSLKDAQDINWQYDPDSAVLPSNTWTSHVDNESGKSMGAVSKDAFTTLMGAGKSSAAVVAGQRKSNRTRRPSTKVLQAQDVPSKGKRKSSPAPTKRRIYRKASDGFRATSISENSDLSDAPNDTEGPQPTSVAGDTDLDDDGASDDIVMESPSLEDLKAIGALDQGSTVKKSTRTLDVYTVFEKATQRRIFTQANVSSREV